MLLLKKAREVAEELGPLYPVKRIAAFGSAARQQENSESDMDLLIELEDIEPAAYAKTYFALQQIFAERLGRKVDVLTPPMLKNPILKRSIERDLVTLYDGRNSKAQWRSVKERNQEICCWAGQ